MTGQMLIAVFFGGLALSFFAALAIGKLLKAVASMDDHRDEP